MSEYQPKTGARCSCKRGVQRDNCKEADCDMRDIGLLAQEAINEVETHKEHKCICPGCGNEHMTADEPDDRLSEKIG